MNYLFYFRNKPALGHKFNTRMAQDIAEILNTKYERKNFSLTLPDAFDFMPGIEKVASNSLQPLKLFYEHRRVTDSIAVIFVNKVDECACIKNGKKARKLF